jgi:BolA family transcriptional regulator, general stress-responsive regulator
MSRKKRLHDALSSELLPVFLTLDDESGNHRRPGVETHFKAILVSDKFIKLSRLDRHRLVNNLAAGEFKTGLHALSLHLYTPDEWEARGNPVPQSPRCHTQK